MFEFEKRSWKGNENRNSKQTIDRRKTWSKGFHNAGKNKKLSVQSCKGSHWSSATISSRVHIRIENSFHVSAQYVCFVREIVKNLAEEASVLRALIYLTANKENKIRSLTLGITACKNWGLHVWCSSFIQLLWMMFKERFNSFVTHKSRGLKFSTKKPTRVLG